MKKLKAMNSVCVGWPQAIPLGALSIEIVPTDEEALVDLMDGDLVGCGPFTCGSESAEFVEVVPLALYDGSSLCIHHRVRDGTIRDDRIDLDICHEIVHVWEDLILGGKYPLEESEVQSLAVALHQLLVAVQR